jgi:hypothetical protein
MIDVSSRLVPQEVIDLKPITPFGWLGGRCQSGCTLALCLAPERDAVRVTDVRDALSGVGSARDSS